MRLFLDGVISEGDIAELAKHVGRSHDFSGPAIGRIVAEIRRHAPVVDRAPSYWITEHQPEGHDPHYDGCRSDANGGFKPNHMPWCQYSAVSVLSEPESFDGGVFSFHDPEESYKEGLRGSLLVYSSGINNNPQKHSASPHSNGRRLALLMFFATDGSVDL